jgi:cytochrome c oxidase subunit IV
MSEHSAKAAKAAEAAAGGHGYKIYWILWVVLLAATVTMIFIGESNNIPEPAQAIMLLLGSSIKATLIIFFYMHLRFEKMSLILTVLVGIFVTSILMFIVPAFDGTSNFLVHRLYQ